MEHPLPLDAAPRCVASRRISITSLSALPLPSSRQTPPKTCKDHPPSSVDVSVPRFRSLFENYQILSNSWLGSSLCAATKGVISWIPPRREFPAACGVSYTGYIYIVSSLLTGVQTFLFRGGETRFDSLRFRSIFNAIVDGKTRIDVFFYFFFIY